MEHPLAQPFRCVQFRTAFQRNGVTAMGQSIGTVPATAVTGVLAQLEDVHGTLETNDSLPEGILAMWTENGGESKQLLVSETRTVWWQTKGRVGVWCLWWRVLGEGQMRQRVFRMRPGKDTLLNLVKIMSSKLKVRPT